MALHKKSNAFFVLMQIANVHLSRRGVRLMYKKIETYFKKHVYYNSAVHVLAGVGIGILLTYPLAGAHPVRWGGLFLAAGLLGHMYPLLKKGKN